MTEKGHGTCAVPVMEGLRFGVDTNLSDRISCYNKLFAEPRGYFVEHEELENELLRLGKMTFYDSVTGKPLFIAPKNRTVHEFLAESAKIGWLTFHDEEVLWENVKVLGDGEIISSKGTHLGHNLALQI